MKTFLRLTLCRIGIHLRGRDGMGALWDLKQCSICHKYNVNFLITTEERR